MLLDMPLYSDKVTVCNPAGTVGILTLWSKLDVVIRKIGVIPWCVAAISNFYGDGISQLLANLLHNPQISKLYVLGVNRTGSLEELQKFFVDGIETVKINGAEQIRIAGTTRLLNSAIDRGLFVGREVDIVHCPGASLDPQIAFLLDALSRESSVPRVLDRLLVRLIDPVISTLPNVYAGHQVVCDGILDAWAEVLFKIQRFGLPTRLAKGDRKELLSLKVVITNPGWASQDEYQKYNLDGSRLRDYCDVMLRPSLDADTSYTYGHRLRTYFGYDMVDRAVERLSLDREDRKCYWSLWDPRFDMYDCDVDGSPRGHPCWVGGFLRVHDGKLSLLATFRTHRAYTAWVENAHGLMNLQSVIASRLDIPVGPLVIVSNSISIDPGQLPLVDSIIKSRKWRLRDDGRGEVVFSIDGGEAVVEHRSGGIVLKRYRSSNIEVLSHQLSQDMVVSDLGHSLYVGRQLGKIQMCLEHGLEYVES